jgi:hypothetical protein
VGRWASAYAVDRPKTPDPTMKIEVGGEVMLVVALSFGSVLLSKWGGEEVCLAVDAQVECRYL